MASEQDVTSDSLDSSVVDVPKELLGYVKSSIVDYINKATPEQFSAKIHYAEGQSPKLEVSIGGPQSQSTSSSDDDLKETTTILVKNLPETVDEELLEIFFESTKKQGGGPVKSVKILSDKKAAFVEFCERKSVETVLKKKPIKYGKTELDIKPFKSLLIRGSEKVNMVDLKGLSVSDEFTDGLVKRQLESLLVPEYGPELASLIKVGTRVVRGRDWNYVNSDGGPGGQGTVTAIDGDSRDKTLTIRWDTEGEYTGYPMGSGGYAVKLAP